MGKRILVDAEDYFTDSRGGGSSVIADFIAFSKWQEERDEKNKSKDKDKKDDKKPEKKMPSTTELVMWLNFMAIVIGPIYWNYLMKVMH